jgi:hypothetical protein
MQENLGSRHGKKTDITTRTQILPLPLRERERARMQTSLRSFGSNGQQTLKDKIRTTECPCFMKIQKLRPDCSKLLEIEIEIERDIRQTERQTRQHIER